ncbi:MAG: hypothetical protein HOV79_01865 [Hamadaea sp.]|nr:hypothetical protein [Hamadaea sp.]
MTWFTRRDLRDLAGDASFDRGLEYVDAVGDVRQLPDGVVASVDGSDRYRVRLRQRDGLDGDCSCPYGQEGNFCKHCVAVGLRLLKRGRDGAAIPAQRREVDVRGYLEGLERSALVELVWAHAQEDAALYERITLAAATSGDPVDLDHLRRAVEDLQTGWLDYIEVEEYAESAHRLVEAIGTLGLDHPAEARTLLERSIDLLMLTRLQAEDGFRVEEVIADAMEHYQTACRAAPSDGTALGKWLLRMRLEDSELIRYEGFADLLGTDGRAAYRADLEEFARLRPDDVTVRWLREELAQDQGLDALIAVWSERLTSALDYSRIAKALAAAGRPDEAITWLERGVADGRHRDPAGDSLVNQLCEFYESAGRLADRLQLREERLAAVPDGDSWKRLKAAAVSDRVWRNIQPRALRVLEKSVKRASAWMSLPVGGPDLYVHALLGEGMVDEAWLVAEKHECHHETLKAVADARGKFYPADTVGAYKKIITRLINVMTSDSYREAAEQIAGLKPLFQRAAMDFPAYVRELRDIHKRKRNFIAELDRQRLPA